MWCTCESCRRWVKHRANVVSPKEAAKARRDLTDVARNGNKGMVLGVLSAIVKGPTAQTIIFKAQRDFDRWLAALEGP